jgi:ketosteroid isomerase-like protein
MDALALARHLWQPAHIDELADHLAPDVSLAATIPDRPPRSVELRGREAVVAYFASLPAIGEFDPLAGPLEFLGDAAGNRVAVIGDMRYRVDASGAAGRGEYAFVMEFRDGAITRILDLMDLSDVIEPMPSQG